MKSYLCLAFILCFSCIYTQEVLADNPSRLTAGYTVDYGATYKCVCEQDYLKTMGRPSVGKTCEFNSPFFSQGKYLSFQTVQSSKSRSDDTRNTLGMMLGVSYGKLRTNDLSDPDFNFTPSWSKWAGFTLEIPMQKMEKRGSFYSEITFSQFEANSFVHFADSSLGHPERDYYEITQKFAPNAITVTNMFRYCFTNNDFKYYVAAGIYNSFIISAVNSRKTAWYQAGESNTEEEEAIPDHSIHGLMLVVSTGIAYKYAGLEFRYDPGRNYTRKVDYSVHQPSAVMVLHVRFNP